MGPSTHLLVGSRLPNVERATASLIGRVLRATQGRDSFESRSLRVIRSLAFFSDRSRSQ